MKTSIPPTICVPVNLSPRIPLIMVVKTGINHSIVLLNKLSIINAMIENSTELMFLNFIKEGPS